MLSYTGLLVQCSQQKSAEPLSNFTGHLHIDSTIKDLQRHEFEFLDCASAKVMIG